jgi:uncharacterized membrane protein HdeD (DUF308 family)
MGSVLTRAIAAIVGGLYFIGFYFWSESERSTNSRAALYTGLFTLCVGILGLVYWRWRTDQKRAQQIASKSPVA